MVDTGTRIKPAIACIEAIGTTQGLFIEMEKSQFLQSPGVSEETARASTDPLEWSNGEGTHQLSFFCGVWNDQIDMGGG